MLRVYRVHDALPESTPITLSPESPEPVERVFLAGDHLALPALEGAVRSGLAAARVVADRVGLPPADPDLPDELPSFTASFDVRAPLAAVAAFHEGPDALARLQPPLSRTRFERVDSLGDGSVTEFTMGLGPLRLRWRAVHRDVRPGTGFTDVQECGPMARWVHRHEYRSDGPRRTRVIDRIWIRHRRGPRGLMTRLLFHRLVLRALFLYRSWATRRAVG